MSTMLEDRYKEQPNTDRNTDDSTLVARRLDRGDSMHEVIGSIPIVIHSFAIRFVPVHTSTYKYIAVYSSMRRFVLVCTCMYLFILVYTCMYLFAHE